MPWVSTAVPWYASMLGLGLALRGREVTFIWDDTGFPDARLEVQNRSIGQVLDRVKQFVPVVRLSDHTGTNLNREDLRAIDRLTDQNATWVTRGAAAPTRDQRHFVEEIRRALTRSMPLVKGALDRCDTECLVVPGG